MGDIASIRCRAAALPPPFGLLPAAALFAMAYHPAPDRGFSPAPHPTPPRQRGEGAESQN